MINGATMDSILKDQQRQRDELAKLISASRKKTLLPGIAREAFEAALEMGFNAGWATKGRA